MRDFINQWTPWFIELSASRILCAAILIAVFVDAARTGLVQKAVRLVLLPFLVGVALFEVIRWLPSPNALLFWLCVTSVYYVSVRLNNGKSTSPLNSWSLAQSFALTWTVFSAATAAVWSVIYSYHFNYMISAIQGRSSLSGGLLQRFLLWLVVVAAACVVGHLFRSRAGLPATASSGET